MSGNPGYISGLPVLAGNAVTTGSGALLKTAISARVVSFSLVCFFLIVFLFVIRVVCPFEGPEPLVSAVPTVKVHFLLPFKTKNDLDGVAVPVLFGVDSIIPCVKNFTAQELQAACIQKV